jgi:raffinose/stachyose/melibiose transport system substrate-binding protein
MKKALAILLAMLVAGALFAQSGTKTLRVYMQGLTPREKLESERVTPPSYLWTVAKAYQKLHPDITIEFVPEIRSNYEEWFMTQMAGGTAPDVVWYQRGYIQRDYKKNWLADLTGPLNEKNPYAPSYARWYDIFQQPAIESGRAPDGKIYMLTGDIVGTGIFYNKDLFKKAGITKEPDTWAEFMADCKKLKAIGVVPFSTSMSMEDGGVRLYGSWFTREIQDVLYNNAMDRIKGSKVERTWKPGEGLPTKVMVNAIVKGRYAATDPQFKDMLRVLKDFSQYWPDGFWAINTDSNQVYDYWAKGQAAMGWFGSWMTKTTMQDPLINFKWGVFKKFPTITKETSQFGGSEFPMMGGVGGVFQYAVPEFTKDRGTYAAAIDWLRYVTNPPTIVATLNDHGGFAPAVMDTKGAIDSLKVYTDMMAKNGTERIEPFDSMLTREFLDDFFSRVQVYLMGKTDLDSTAAGIQGSMMKAAKQLLQENPDWAEK